MPCARRAGATTPDAQGDRKLRSRGRRRRPILGCGGDSGEGAQSGAGGQADAGSLTTLDVGIIGIAADAPIWVAMERGFFEEKDLKIETHTAAGGAAIVPAVVSGDLDIGTGGLLSVISAGARGLPLKVLVEDGVVLSHATAASAVAGTGWPAWRW